MMIIRFFRVLKEVFLGEKGIREQFWEAKARDPDEKHSDNSPGE